MKKQKVLSPNTWRERGSGLLDCYTVTWGCYRPLWIQMWQLYSCSLYLSRATGSYGTMTTITIYGFDRTHYRLAMTYYDEKQVLLMYAFGHGLNRSKNRSDDDRRYAIVSRKNRWFDIVAVKAMLWSSSPFIITRSSCSPIDNSIGFYTCGCARSTSPVSCWTLQQPPICHWILTPLQYSVRRRQIITWLVSSISCIFSFFGTILWHWQPRSC